MTKHGIILLCKETHAFVDQSVSSGGCSALANAFIRQRQKSRSDFSPATSIPDRWEVVAYLIGCKYLTTDPETRCASTVTVDMPGHNGKSTHQCILPEHPEGVGCV